MEMDGVVNGILSFVIPGLGQAIEGYKIRGLILFIIAIIVYFVFFYFEPLRLKEAGEFLHKKVKVGSNIQYIFTAVYGLIAGYDAYRLY